MFTEPWQRTGFRSKVDPKKTSACIVQAHRPALEAKSLNEDVLRVRSLIRSDRRGREGKTSATSSSASQIRRPTSLASHFDFRSTNRSTESRSLQDFRGFRRSPRVCKSLKNLKREDCHGRGRGFEPRRPRHTFQKSSLEWAETTEGAKGHRFVSFSRPFYVDSRRSFGTNYGAG